MLLHSFIPVDVYGIKIAHNLVSLTSKDNEISFTNQPKILVRRRMTEVCVNLTQFTLYKEYIISEMLKKTVHQIQDNEPNNSIFYIINDNKIENVYNPITNQWQRPKYVNCGVKYLYIRSPLTASYYCDSDVLVSEYNIRKFNKLGIP